MMFYFLFLILVILIWGYMFCKRDELNFADPFFLVIASHFLSVSFVVLNYKLWEVDKNLGSYAVFLIILSILMFGLGVGLASWLYNLIPKKRVDVDNHLYGRSISIQNSVILYCLCLVTVSILIYIYDLSRKSGLAFGEVLKFMTIVRKLITDEGLSVGIIPIQLMGVCRALAYVFIYAFLWNVIYFKQKKYRFLLIPIAYSALTLISSGRIHLLYIVIYIIIIYFLLSKNIRLGKVGTIFKVFFCVFFGIVFFMILFGALANLVGRNTTHTIYEQISVYTGGSIVAFGKFINDFEYSKPAIVGEESFTGIYSLLNTIGITNIQASRHLTFTRFGDSWGNVYMALRRYIHDFDVGQAMIIMLLIGFVYSFTYKCIKRKKILTVSHVYYGMLIYPIPMLVVDDVLFSSLISLNTLLDIVYVTLAFRLIIPLRKKQRNEKNGNINIGCECN